ncbi:MAG: YARHG domain-containing protein [Clostridium sp.]|nr:YARHG domain-containing protein [Prevotella sp.]MCM1429325.1 YARHG domain-containing protein [Clostridium sp.]MCM1475641.1 YARHG domain-containing protein [Muribaculaceae bacterium]
MASCSNDTEKKLNGKWIGSVDLSDGDASGDMTIKMKLDAESHDFVMTFIVNMEGIGEIATMKTAGSWSATSDEILFDFSKDKMKFKFSDEMKAMASLAGVEIDEMTDELTQQMTKELEGLSSMSIISLTETKLKVKEDGETIIFHRPGSSNDDMTVRGSRRDSGSNMNIMEANFGIETRGLPENFFESFWNGDYSGSLESIITDFNLEQRRIIRNSYYARHGYIFQSDDLAKFFSQFDWYRPNSRDVTNLLSSSERDAVIKIKEYEY